MFCQTMSTDFALSYNLDSCFINKEQKVISAITYCIIILDVDICMKYVTIKISIEQFFVNVVN